MTPNPKIFQKSSGMRAHAHAGNTKSKKNGLKENKFAGLSNYILSEIDSSGDENNKRNYLTESSFSNSHSSGSSDGSYTGQLGQGVLMSQAANKACQQIWEDTDASSLTKDSLKGFITESPFSFKNPIFFSVPPKMHTKKVDLFTSKRTLFPNMIQQQT